MYTHQMEPKVLKKADVRKATCPSRDALDLIADKWAVLIIYTLSRGTMRHNELARALVDISQKVLTQALRKLERNGIVARTVFPVVPPRVEYALTPLGTSLVGILRTLTTWAEVNFGAVEAARKRFDESPKP